MLYATQSMIEAMGREMFGTLWDTKVENSLMYDKVVKGLGAALNAVDEIDFYPGGWEGWMRDNGRADDI